MSVVYDYQVTDMDGRGGVCGVAETPGMWDTLHTYRSSGTIGTVGGSGWGRCVA